MSGAARWLVPPRGSTRGSSIQCCCGVVVQRLQPLTAHRLLFYHCIALCMQQQGHWVPLLHCGVGWWLRHQWHLSVWVLELQVCWPTISLLHVHTAPFSINLQCLPSIVWLARWLVGWSAALPVPQARLAAATPAAGWRSKNPIFEKVTQHQHQLQYSHTRSAAAAATMLPTSGPHRTIWEGSLSVSAPDKALPGAMTLSEPSRMVLPGQWQHTPQWGPCQTCQAFALVGSAALQQLPAMGNTLKVNIHSAVAPGLTCQPYRIMQSVLYCASTSGPPIAKQLLLLPGSGPSLNTPWGASKAQAGEWKPDWTVLNNVAHMMPHCAVLRCAVLCCAVLCCAVLCCAVLYAGMQTATAATQPAQQAAILVVCQTLPPRGRSPAVWPHEHASPSTRC